MSRALLMAFVCVGLVAGCANPQHQIEMPKKPVPAAELAKLKCFVGTWTSTAEIDVPAPAEGKKDGGAKAKPMTFQAGAKYEWTLGGMFLRCDGWHDMGDGQKETLVAYIGWDAKTGRYSARSVSDWGGVNEAFMTLDADGKTFRMHGKTTDADGNVRTGEGMMKVIDDNTIEWTWTESTLAGKAKFHGTDKRQP